MHNVRVEDFEFIARYSTCDIEQPDTVAASPPPPSRLRTRCATLSSMPSSSFSSSSRQCTCWLLLRAPLAPWIFVSNHSLLPSHSLRTRRHVQPTATEVSGLSARSIIAHSPQYPQVRLCAPSYLQTEMCKRVTIRSSLVLPGIRQWYRRVAEPPRLRQITICSLHFSSVPRPTTITSLPCAHYHRGIQCH